MTQENGNFWLGSAFILKPANALAWTASRFLHAENFVDHSLKVTDGSRYSEFNLVCEHSQC